MSHTACSFQCTANTHRVCLSSVADNPYTDVDRSLLHNKTIICWLMQ